uniref:NADH-ubiquinone oxidoreductase chain 2 n=1 Tax=Sitona obsoletus TaxID=1541163 RepID=A0A411LWR2_9CUCU|nr:NADH dehydrogenase subunit 2 [Sitona obsoletus]QBF03820.1 NADH dehydrogenase subunit 2 [Sitona obsoletus]
MVKLHKIMFLNSMFMGTMISISSFSWISAWIGLEINLLSILPLLKDKKNSYPAESALKYFITQTMASSLLLFSVILSMNMNNLMISEFNLTSLIIMSSALLLKMGAAPFHFWFPEMISGLSWSNSLIMLTWQKIAPMVLISYLVKMYTILFSIIIIASSIISGLQGLNQICLRKILAYSSINHVSWMLSSLLNSLYIWMFYFLTYSLINMNIILIFKKFKIFYMNQLINIMNFKKKIKFLFMLNFLSLGGLPPFLGFLPKWLTINSLIEHNHFTLMITLIIFTLVSLYFYLRIVFSTFTINSEKTMVYMYNKMSYFHFMINSLALLGLIMCTMINLSY